MDIYRDVVNRSTVPPSEDEEAAFQYGSKRLVASAICQTYHYMLEGGLTYSYLTTGEAIVFFRIDLADPSTLQYHLAQPREEVEVQREERPEEALRQKDSGRSLCRLASSLPQLLSQPPWPVGGDVRCGIGEAEPLFDGPEPSLQIVDVTSHGVILRNYVNHSRPMTESGRW